MYEVKRSLPLYYRHVSEVYKRNEIQCRTNRTTSITVFNIVRCINQIISKLKSNHSDIGYGINLEWNQRNNIIMT